MHVRVGGQMRKEVALSLQTHVTELIALCNAIAITQQQNCSRFSQIETDEDYLLKFYL